MKNLLREEFYKSNKGITQYICIGIALLTLLVVIFVYDEIYMGYHWLDLQAEIPWVLDFSGFIAVFAMVYICSEFSKKTIKNYVGLGFSRNEIYFTKIIKVAVITFGLVLIMQLFSGICSPFVFDGNSFDFGANLVYYFYGLLALIECICVYVAIAFLTRSIVAVIAVYFGVPVFVTIVETIKFFWQSPVLDFFSNVFKYTYIDYQKGLAEQIAFGGVSLPVESILLIVIPVVVSLIATLGGLIAFNKTDIK